MLKEALLLEPSGQSASSGKRPDVSSRSAAEHVEIDSSLEIFQGPLGPLSHSLHARVPAQRVKFALSPMVQKRLAHCSQIRVWWPAVSVSKRWKSGADSSGLRTSSSRSRARLIHGSVQVIS